MLGIHPTAVVHDRAQVSSTASIGPFSIIEEDVIIGDITTIATHVRILSGTRIGKNCTIHHDVVIGGAPQSISFDPKIKTFVEIGDHTEIREFCTVHRATTESYTTHIGDHCLMLPYSHVPHDGQIGNYVTLEEFVELGGHTHIDDHSIVRSNFPVHQFTHIGKYCDVGCGINKDIPPYIRFNYAGVGSIEINIEKLRERKFTDETIAEIKSAYTIFYKSGLNVSQAVERIKSTMQITEPIREIISFIEKTKRGVTSGWLV